MARPSSSIALFCSACLLTACASSSSDIAPVYISPLQFQAYDCDQLTAETQRIQTRVTQISGRLDEAAKNDKSITGAGLVLIWPLLFLGGNKQQEAEYARLKGEYDAVQQAAIQKRCTGIVQSTPNAAPTSPAAPSPR